MVDRVHGLVVWLQLWHLELRQNQLTYNPFSEWGGGIKAELHAMLLSSTLQYLNPLLHLLKSPLHLDIQSSIGISVLRKVVAQDRGLPDHEVGEHLCCPRLALLGRSCRLCPYLGLWRGDYWLVGRAWSRCYASSTCWVAAACCISCTTTVKAYTYWTRLLNWSLETIGADWGGGGGAWTGSHATTSCWILLGYASFEWRRPSSSTNLLLPKSRPIRSHWSPKKNTRCWWTWYL